MTYSPLTRRIRAELPNTNRFDELAGRCLGAWPVDILETLERIAAAPSSLSRQAESLVEDARRPVGPSPTAYPELPLEHPIDSDWRFARHEPGRLLTDLLSDIGPSEKLLAICVPTIVLEAGKRGIGARLVVGIRSADPITGVLRSLVPEATYISLDAMHDIGAGAGIVDPPWHDCIANPLIGRLIRGVRPGGRVLITGPDRLTSASSVARLRSATVAPPWLGLQAGGATTTIRYQTPHFEARALQVSGVANVPNEWRTGLVHSYRRTTEICRTEALETDEVWSETSIEGHRIWVRPRLGSADCASFAVSTSISRTCPSRRTASVWTSGNTVVIGGSTAQLERLATGRLDGSDAEFVKRLRDWEERFCWQPSSTDAGSLRLATGDANVHD